MKARLLAISGSTRTSSTNLNLINAIAALSSEIFDISVVNYLAEIPHFNPDLDNETVPEKVKQFRQQISEADAVLICTPEYAMGVPGTLKNAIDWTVSSSNFSHKPTALITASSQGQKGHASLLETLKVIEAAVTDKTQLLISYAKTKINHNSVIVDEATLKEVETVIEELYKLTSNAKKI